MRIRRIEPVIQFVTDQQASSGWHAKLLDLEPTPYDAPYFKPDERAYLILAPGSPGTGRDGPGCWFLVDSVDEAYQEKSAHGFTFSEPPFDIPRGRLVTLNDLDGNIVGLIDSSKSEMPGQRA